MATRTTIHGSNNQTPGVMSAPSTLLTGTTSTTGLTLKQNASAPAGQVMLRMLDTDGTTAYAEITNGLDFAAYGMHIGAAGGVFVATMRLDGTGTIPRLRFPDGTGTGASWWSGTGAPSSTTVGTAAVGDLYLRRDTPSTANQRLYICTAAGSPGTWTGIA